MSAHFEDYAGAEDEVAAVVEGAGNSGGCFAGFVVASVD